LLYHLSYAPASLIISCFHDCRDASAAAASPKPDYLNEKLTYRIFSAGGAGMEHAILGAGAIGGLVGTALASLGEDVTVLVRPERVPGYPANLLVERPSGTITAPAKAAATLTKPVDVLWIATKTYQLQAALEAVQATPAHVVPLLNGVDHVEILRVRFGRDRVLPATIAVEAERIAPGRFVQRSPFVNLNVAAGGEPLLGTIVAGLRGLGFTCRFIQNEQTLLWSKLCFLGPFALVTSASGMNKGEIYADSEWKHKLLSAIAEACAVAKASSAEVDATRIQAIFDDLPAGIRSSMQKDLAARRPLELDAIGGAIARGGERYGINVSTTAALMAAIRARM
jgi:2-dehydropantoate 2-reductase